METGVLAVETSAPTPASVGHAHVPGARSPSAPFTNIGSCSDAACRARPGKKHRRRIELEPWQRAITHAHPRELIRGLIHSDGCRCVNRFQTKLPSGRIAQYAYVRYFFSNLSEDIEDVFCEHCDLLGIRWSRASARYVSVHDRKSVALIDEFVGPKA